MTEMVMAQKRRVLVVGGMEYNVPPELKEAFEIAKHITQGSKFQTLPACDYVFVITEWASHNLVEAVKDKVSAPVIPLVRGGWKAIREDLERRSILTPNVTTQGATAPQITPEQPSAESLFSSMSEAEVWKKYGSSLIEAVQGTLKPKEVICEDDVLEALSLSGVPKADCGAFLPKLQLKGILDPCGDGKWRLMAAPGVDFDNERVDPSADKEVLRGKGKARGSNTTAGNVVLKPGRKLRSPALVVMIGGLPRGPYSAKRAIVDEMRKYIEFDALSDWQVSRYVDRAISEKIVDDSRKDLFVNQNAEIVLTKKRDIEGDLKAPDEIVKEAEMKQTLLLAPGPTLKKIDRTEAEKAWCHVVENVRKERDRLGNLLAHCRIEWMGDNHVLVIFLPAVLAQWMKFVESTENWGLVSRHVQDRLSKATAIRFMLDNGLRV